MAAVEEKLLVKEWTSKEVPAIFRPKQSKVEYSLISPLKQVDLHSFCLHNGLRIKCRYNSGNISITCRRACPYLAFFVSQFDAIYGTKCRQHNHEIGQSRRKHKRALKPKIAKQKAAQCNWRFIAYVKSRKEMDGLCQKFGLNRGHKQAIGQYFACKQHVKYLRSNKKSKDCGMRGVLMKSNSCFYLTGEHSHQNKGAKENGQNKSKLADGNEDEEPRMIAGSNLKKRREFDENEEQQEEEDIADSRSFLGLEECDYQREIEENEKITRNNNEEGEPDYMDRNGNIWAFLAHIQNAEELQNICQQNCLKKHRENNTTVNFKCKANQSANCPFRATLIKTNSCLYFANCHNHKQMTFANPATKLNMCQDQMSLSL